MKMLIFSNCFTKWYNYIVIAYNEVLSNDNGSKLPIECDW